MSQESSRYTVAMMVRLASEYKEMALKRSTNEFGVREIIIADFNKESGLDLNANKLAGIFTRYGVTVAGFICRYHDQKPSGAAAMPLTHEDAVRMRKRLAALGTGKKSMRRKSKYDRLQWQVAALARSA